MPADPFIIPDDADTSLRARSREAERTHRVNLEVEEALLRRIDAKDRAFRKIRLAGSLAEAQDAALKGLDA